VIIVPVTPEMTTEKIEQIDKHSEGFIYLSLSAAAEAGENKEITHYKRDF
jgi:tryptophan synthase alpha subunit